MYVGWADGRGMRVRSSGEAASSCSRSPGSARYTLLKPESGLHVLELPHGEDRGVRPRHRATSTSSPARPARSGSDRRIEREPAIVRRYRHEPSPLVRNASGLRTGRIDRVLAGDFDLLQSAAD